MAQTQSKLSKALQNQLEAISSRTVIVATVCTVPHADSASFSDFNLSAKTGEITAGEPVLLPRTRGLFAARNLDGWVEKRKDLPKESREISSLAPDWNGNGYHLISRTIEAWPVQHHRARLNTISAKVLEQLRDGALVRFRVDQPLCRESDTFAVDLNFNIRLLREAVGSAKIYSADMSDQEFAKVQTVDWAMLPAGSVDRVLAQLAARPRVSEERMRVAGERLRTLDRLGHDGYIVGIGRFSNYFGVQFGHRLVALENLEYGNALYMFEENWEELSKLSRSELIRRRDPQVHRIPHLPGWQSAIRKLLRRP
jgi:hypothetical protein